MKVQMAQIYQTLCEKFYETEIVLLWSFPPQSKKKKKVIYKVTPRYKAAIVRNKVAITSHIVKKSELPKQLFNCKSHSVRLSYRYKKQSCKF